MQWWVGYVIVIDMNATSTSPIKHHGLNHTSTHPVILKMAPDS